MSLLFSHIKSIAGDQENKRARLEPPSMQQVTGAGPGGQPGGVGGPQQANGPQLTALGTPGAFRGPLNIINKEMPPEHLKPRVLLSSIKNKDEIERVCVSYVQCLIYLSLI